MKIRSLIVATVLLLALGGALYWSEHRKPGDEAAKASADTPPTILKLDQAAITKLEIKKKDAEPIVLTKSSSGNWQISQPKLLNAEQGTVSGTLSMLSSLNSERLIEDNASDLKRYGLGPPSLEVAVTEKDNKTQKLLLGDVTPAGSAVYAMLAGDRRVFTMASYNKSSLDKSLNELRDKRLLTMQADKISRVEVVHANQTMEFGRNKDEWQVLRPRPMRADSAQVGELVRKLADATMDLSGSDRDPKETAPRFAHAMPVATAKVTGQSGTQELQVRKNKDNKDDDTYYAKSSVVEGIYKVDSPLGKALEKNLDDFRNKRLFDFGFNDPTKIEMHSGSKAYFLTKGSSDWWSNGKKLDGGSVQSYLSNLRDLAASSFVESGFANPSIDVMVAWDDGKRVEKVSIAKSGRGYIAKRANEPTLYKLESSSVDALQRTADDLKLAATGK